MPSLVIEKPLANVTNTANASSSTVKPGHSRTHSRRNSITDVNTIATITALQSQVQRLTAFNATLETENTKLLNIIETNSNVRANDLIQALRFSSEQRYAILEYRYAQLQQSYDSVQQKNIDLQCQLHAKQQSSENDEFVVYNAKQQIASLDVDGNHHTGLQAENTLLKQQLQQYADSDSKLQQAEQAIDALEQQLHVLLASTMLAEQAAGVAPATEPAVTPKHGKQRYNDSTLLRQSPLSEQSEQALLSELGVAHSDKINPSAMWTKLCETNKKLEVQAESHSQTVKQLQQQIELLQQQLASIDSARTESDTQLQEQYNAHIDALQLKLQSTADSLTDVTAQLQQLTRKHDSMQQQYEMELKVKQSNVDEAEQRYKQEQVAHKQLRKMHSELTDKYEQLQNKQSMYVNELTHAQNTIAELQQQCEQQTQQVQQLQINCDGLQQQCTECSEQLCQLTQQLQQAQTEHQTQTAALNGTITDLRSQLSDIKSALNDTVAQIKSLEANLSTTTAKYTKQVASLNHDIANQQSEISDLTAQLKIKTDALNVYHQQIAENAKLHAKKQAELEAAEREKSAHRISYALKDLKSAIFDKPVQKDSDDTVWHVDPLTGKKVNHTLAEEVAVALSTRVQQLEQERAALLNGK